MTETSTGPPTDVPGERWTLWMAEDGTLRANLITPTWGGGGVVVVREGSRGDSDDRDFYEAQIRDALAEVAVGLGLLEHRRYIWRLARDAGRWPTRREWRFIILGRWGDM